MNSRGTMVGQTGCDQVVTTWENLARTSTQMPPSLWGFGDKDVSFLREARIQFSLDSLMACFRVSQKIWPPSGEIREAFLFLLRSASPSA